MSRKSAKNGRFIIIYFSLLSSTLFAQIPAAFVDIGFGARPMGMGGAFTALSNDVHSIFWNPAGLTSIEQSQFTIMHTKQLGIVPYSLGAYATKVFGQYVGVSFLTSGNDVLKENTMIFSFARALKLPILGSTRFGTNIRYRASSFGKNEDGGENRSQGSASGYGFDLGFIWQAPGKTNIGLFLRDFANNMSYDNTTRQVKYSENVPTSLILGFAKKIHSHTNLAIDFEISLYKDNVDKIHVGGEVTLLKMILLRGGMWQNIDTNINRNYSVGVGLNVKKRNFGIQFDFAYLINDLANSPRISFSIFH